MKNTSKTSNLTRAGRQIVGFSLPPELATEVKIEAARRGLSLRKLFEEIWAIYKTKRYE